MKADSHIHLLEPVTRTHFSAWHHFAELESTNDWLAAQNKPGLICQARRQTGGKGRRGRSWVSDASGNLYFSFSMAHEPGLPLPPLSLLAGIAVCQALQRSGVNGHALKWPNDIYWHGRKLGGILVESHNNLRLWVIGIGINITTAPDSKVSQDAVALKEYLDKSIDPSQLAAMIVDEYIDLVVADTPWQMLWEQWDMLRNREILVYQGNDVQALPYVARGIDEQGNLLVENASGVSSIHAGEVSIRW